MSNTSPFEQLTGIPVNPLWMLRIFALVVCTALILAMFVFKTGTAHSVTVGFALGILVGLTVQLFSARGVDLGQTSRPPDVDDLHVTA